MIKLSVLIPTVGERNEKFTKLLKFIDKHILPDVEVIAYWNNGEVTIGEIRQALVTNAKGEYVVFIDDDDQIPDFYFKEILTALKKDVDYVGFQMQAYNRDDKLKPTYHSLRYSNWFEDEKGFYRDISHINPIRRSLANKVSFGKEHPEDERWAVSLRPHINTEFYIDKIMYEYLHDPVTSVWQGVKTEKTYYRPDIGYAWFRWHPASKERNE